MLTTDSRPIARSCSVWPTREVDGGWAVVCKSSFVAGATLLAGHVSGDIAKPIHPAVWTYGASWAGPSSSAGARRMGAMTRTKEEEIGSKPNRDGSRDGAGEEASRESGDRHPPHRG